MDERVHSGSFLCLPVHVHQRVLWGTFLGHLPSTSVSLVGFFLLISFIAFFYVSSAIKGQKGVSAPPGLELQISHVGAGIGTWVLSKCPNH